MAAEPSIPDMPEDFDGTEAEWAKEYLEDQARIQDLHAQHQRKAMKAEVEAEEFNPDEGEEPTVWAAITYEEGTGGPLQQAGGILIDDPDGVTILDPETGNATIIGDRFVIRIDIIQVEVEVEDEMEDDE